MLPEYTRELAAGNLYIHDNLTSVLNQMVSMI